MQQLSAPCLPCLHWTLPAMQQAAGGASTGLVSHILIPPPVTVYQGRRTEAEAEFRAVVSQRPECALALGNLAGVLYDQVGAARQPSVGACTGVRPACWESTVPGTSAALSLPLPCPQCCAPLSI